MSNAIYIFFVVECHHGNRSYPFLQSEIRAGESVGVMRSSHSLSLFCYYSECTCTHSLRLLSSHPAPLPFSDGFWEGRGPGLSNRWALPSTWLLPFLSHISSSLIEHRIIGAGVLSPQPRMLMKWQEMMRCVPTQCKLFCLINHSDSAQ